jgi:hypothetical protein
MQKELLYAFAGVGALAVSNAAWAQAEEETSRQATVITGVMIDHFPAPLIGCLFMLAPVVGCIVLIAGTDGHAGAGFAIFLIGFAQGAEFDIMSYLIARYLGMRAFSTVYGFCVMAMSIATAAGGLFFGFTYDATDNYDLALTAAAVVLCSHRRFTCRWCGTGQRLSLIREGRLCPLALTERIGVRHPDPLCAAPRRSPDRTISRASASPRSPGESWCGFADLRSRRTTAGDGCRRHPRLAGQLRTRRPH